MNEQNICQQCGGQKTAYYEPDYINDSPVMPARITIPSNLCWCPTPTQVHDGNLDSRNDCVVAHDDCTTAYGLGGVFRGVSIMSRWVGGGVDMTPQQALSLLDWLRQEEELLQSMVKEQATNE